MTSIVCSANSSFGNIFSALALTFNAMMTPAPLTKATDNIGTTRRTINRSLQESVNLQHLPSDILISEVSLSHWEQWVSLMQVAQFGMKQVTFSEDESFDEFDVLEESDVLDGVGGL